MLILLIILVICSNSGDLYTDPGNFYPDLHEL
jgi:hypothetical protein